LNNIAAIGSFSKSTSSVNSILGSSALRISIALPFIFRVMLVRPIFPSCGSFATIFTT